MTKKIEDLTNSARIAITNALNVEYLRSTLANYSYNEAKLQDGKQLLDDLEVAKSKQKFEYGDKDQATIVFNDLWERFDETYTRHLKLARVALKKDANAARDLNLDGARHKSYSRWLGQAQQFYTGLASRPALASALAAFGVPLEQQASARAALAELTAAKNSLENERGEAQVATRERDAIIDALDEWMGDFVSVAHVAFADQPEHLERLGIFVRS